MEGPSLQDIHKVVDGRMEILFPNRSPQFSTQKGHLIKRSGPTAKSAAELRVSQYSHAMTMTPRLRKFALTAYVIFSVGLARRTRCLPNSRHRSTDQPRRSVKRQPACCRRIDVS